MLWREYDVMESLGRSEDAGVFNTSLIAPEAAEADPEAADILAYLVSKSDIDKLAALVLKYPDNEFLAFELSDRLLRTDAISSQAPLNLASRLVTLGPENAHYRYLKAYVLLSLRTESAAIEAIREIELGNGSSKFEFSYSGYENRVYSLLDKTRAGTLQTVVLRPDETRFYGGLNRRLTDHIEATIIESDQASFLRLTDMAMVVGDRLIRGAERQNLLMNGSLFILSGSHLKLKHAELSSDEAEHVRFHSARGKAVMDIVKRFIGIIVSETEMVMAVIPASAIFLTLLVFSGFFWLITLVVGLIRKMATDVRVSFKKYLQYGSSFVCYFVFISLLSNQYESPFVIRVNLAPEETDHLYLLFLILPLALWAAFRLMSLLPPYDKKKLYRFWLYKTVACAAIYLVWLALGFYINYEEGWQELLYISSVCSIVFLILWAALIYGWFLIRLIPYKRLVKSRGVYLILAVAFLAGLTQLLIKVNFLPWLPSILLIPCSAIIIVHRRSGSMPLLVDALYGFFGKRDEIAATRAKVVRLMPPYMIISWLILLVLAGSTAAHSRRLKTTIKDPLANLGELPLADRSTYESILSRIDFSDVDNASLRGAMSRSDAFGYLSVLGPKELPAILAEARKAEPPATDADLLDLIERCGADVYDIIVESLKEPESEKALIARAKSGDTTVKATLEQLFDDTLSKLNLTNTTKPEGRPYGRFDPRRRVLRRCFDVASGLAFISEPNEEMTRFINILDKIDLTAWQDERLSAAYYFYNSLDSLPRLQASELLKTYLQRTDYSDLSSKDNLSKLEHALTLFADTEIAEQVFTRTSESPLIKKPLRPLSPSMDVNAIPERLREQFTKPRDLAPKFRKAISPYFGNSSIPLLKKQINSDNNDLRAFVVWQLTKLGYKWSDQELKKLFTDKYWKVRVNALFAADVKSLQASCNDENPVVRLIANLLLQQK
jgi:hypothetical protein